METKPTEIFIKVDVKDEKSFEVKCPHCNGDGYTAEHDPFDPHENGECSGGCPIQVQCEYCMATGKIFLQPVPLSSLMDGKERFKMPTDEQIIDVAILMSVEKNQVNKKELANILATCNFILDRLYENNDIMIPSSKE